MWHYQIVKYPDHVQLIEMIDLDDLGKGYVVLDDLVGESKRDILHILTMMIEDIAMYPVIDWKDLPK
jgi:hypothetical protein